MTDIFAEIAALKVEKKATILAHYYQDSEIQELADLTGDSLKLARAATEVPTSTLVLCGVYFMAEMAKMLNPEKKVLFPDLQAGCSLVESCPADKLARFQEILRANGRRFQTVAYVNTSAAVKALADHIVSSSTAVNVIRGLPPDEEILFVPDRHFGNYLEEVTGRPMILWDGACMVHEVLSVGDLQALQKQLPRAVTIAHPECPSNMRALCDYVGGSEGMLRYVAGLDEPTDVLVATEPNMIWRLQSQVPRHRYHAVPGVTCGCNKCPHMARNTLEKLRDCLVSGAPEIHWQPEFDRAREVLQRSLLSANPAHVAASAKQLQLV